MASHPEASRLYHQLVAEWDRPASRDLASISNLLAQLKLQLADLGLLLPQPEAEPAALATARDIFEIGALHALESSDLASFERYLALLSSFYQDPRIVTALSGSPSSRQPAITALNLLRLLSLNRIAEFHTVLESLSVRDDAASSVLKSEPVEWVLQLERSLMQGSYSKVYALCSPTASSSSSHSSTPPRLPVPEFAKFTTPLLETVRSEIAHCDEKAYESLPVPDLKTLLFIDSDQQLQEFARSRNWSIQDNLVHFPSSPLHPSNQKRTQPTATATTLATGLGSTVEDDSLHSELDRNKVIGATLLYAKELESIV
ncbi:proteasome regulatory particle lid subunit RPN12 [Sporobolomyces koalae]|uniref:proteasome regulatory particle lid subunit RPN12 n=1 Tax=Sporobolomyces koalae TaxID=500713 RepID=UPI00318080EA